MEDKWKWRKLILMATLAFLQNKRLCSESNINSAEGTDFLSDEPYLLQTFFMFCFNLSCFFNHDLYFVSSESSFCNLDGDTADNSSTDEFMKDIDSNEDTNC